MKPFSIKMVLKSMEIDKTVMEKNIRGKKGT